MKQVLALVTRWLSGVVQTLRTGNSPLRRALRGLAMVSLVWASWSVSAILSTLPSNVEALLGEPAPRAIKSPRAITYVSDAKTQEARTAAARTVDDVYTGPSREIAREQIARLNDQLQRIGLIRADSQLAFDQKIGALRQTADLHGGDPSALLTVNDEAWRRVVLEALRVLDLIMREEIRPSQLAEARRRAQRLMPSTFTDQEHDLVLALVQDTIVPNSTLDAETTLARRREARNAVAPVYLTIREGEAILREGELVTPLALEQLRTLELYPVDIQWYDAVSDALLSLLLVACVALFVQRSNPLLLYRPRRAWLLTLVLIAVGVGARLVVPGRTVMPYLYPAAAASMVVALLLDVQTTLLVSVVSAVLVGMSAGNSLELAVYTLAGSLVAGMLLWRLEQLGSFVRTTVYLALTNVVVVLSFRLGTHAYDAVGLLQLVMAAIANALVSASLAFVAYTFIGRAFGIATSLQLLELARPNHPLFRQLLMNAPGTYHHSIVVSNMAERAAEATGGDPLLARVGAYYHDI
ncbi:MAG: HDIG domain-containing metalloprotein, partial [Chloroflexota bacterium]